MAQKQLVLSFFADEPAADAAAQTLKDSGTSGDAMGILVLDATGNLKVDKVGARSWGAGAGVEDVVPAASAANPAARADGRRGQSPRPQLHDRPV